MTADRNRTRVGSRVRSIVDAHIGASARGGIRIEAWDGNGIRIRDLAACRGALSS